MKNLSNYILEAKKQNLDIDRRQPKSRSELEMIISGAFKRKQYDLNFIDTSKITDMSELFEGVKHNFDISSWDVSNVKDMSKMFSRCYAFTGKGLENWDISNVTNMFGMFCGCTNFNCDLSTWNVSNVENMSYMFNKCYKFEGKGLENWNVSKVKNMRTMFNGCKFDYDELDWDLSGLSSQLKTSRNYLGD